MITKLALFVCCSVGILFFSTKVVQSMPHNRDQSTQITKVSIGDSQLRFDISLKKGFSETNFQSNQQNLLGLIAVPWRIKVNGRTFSPTSYKTKRANTSSANLATHVEFTGELKEFSWKLTYDLSGPGRITKAFSLTPKRDFQLELVTLWDAKSTSTPVVARTSRVDIAAFYRNGASGMFA